MNARVAFCLFGVGISACAESAPGTEAGTGTPAPSVVVLASAHPNAEAMDQAAGLALEVAHWLSRSPRVVVREVSGRGVVSAEPFVALSERLAVDHVVRIDASGQEAGYRVEGSNGEVISGSVVSNRESLPTAPGRIATQVLTALTTEDPTSPDGLEGAVSASPEAYREFLLALGHASTSSLDPRGRITAYERLVPRLGSYVPAVTELGAAYLDLAGELGGAGAFYQLAGETITRAHELDPGYAPARRLLSSYLAKVGRSEESLALLLEGLAGHPSFSGFHDQVGYVLRYAGLMEASLESYGRSQELDASLENLVAAQDQITKSLIYLGRYPEALASHERMESFVRRLGREPDEKEWFYRGVIHLYANESDVAQEAFRRGQALDPQSIWTTFGRAYAGMARGDSAAVSDVLAELERLQVVDGERHYRLVHFATFLGELDSAMEHLEITVSSGFFAAPYLATDPLTAKLRSHPDFAPLLGQAQERHDTFQRMVTRAAR